MQLNYLFFLIGMGVTGVFLLAAIILFVCQWIIFYRVQDNFKVKKDD